MGIKGLQTGGVEMFKKLSVGNLAYEVTLFGRSGFRRRGRF